MPDRKAPIALHRTFTPQEYERPKRGLVKQRGVAEIRFPGRTQPARQPQIARSAVDDPRRARQRPQVARSLATRHEPARLK